MPADDQIQRDLEDRLRRLNEIGMALSSVQNNLNALLERILQEARRFTRAEAGTLYLARDDHLTFEIIQNDKLQIFVGGSREKVDMPPVAINKESVSGYVAVTGEILNITDVYAEEGQHFEGPRNYDRMTGYHTHSMLVMPMRDHEVQVIGVLQLLNSLDPDSGESMAFSAEDVALIESLASQAAVAINNVRLIEDTEALFESFVQVMATAIDERSPYTGGHIRRVAELTMIMAHAINSCDEGVFADVKFSDEELEELRLAAWMHDIGKITTPEWVVDKPTKLTTIFDRVELVRTRFALIRKEFELQIARGILDAAEGQQLMAEVDADAEFVTRANLPGEYMEDEDLARLQEIAAKIYIRDGEPRPYLTAEELENLSIIKGSLTSTERQKINDHAAMSIKMLEQIPFTRKLRQVPAIAGAHHERLDGTGYPLGLKGDEISLQARILALVDIFESLTADDRPYRAKPLARELVLRILQEMVDDNHIDRDVHEVFQRENLFDQLDEIKAQMARERARA
ncbi:GAF domain-containing protein [bacterium]|nr:GAF domain-containing protein [bacterium]